jgi:hypothetical protein
MIINDKKKSLKIPKNYECINCDYNTSSKKDYNKHLRTLKHIKINNNNNNSIKSPKIPNKYECIYCSKIYMYQSGLSRHKKICSNQLYDPVITTANIKVGEENIDYKQMFLVLVEQLKDQSSLIKEIIPKIGNNIIHNTNTNNNNNVNIQVFLNDTCKDAMSITDFINNIQVSITDLLFTKENGLTKGITNLFLSNLERIPMIQRPLWCSDKKRKRMFIKQDKWTEDMEREKTNELVNTISKIQTKNINKYIADKPNWMTNDKIKDNYMHLIKSVTDSMDNKIDKVIDNIVDKIHLTEDAREKMLK